MEREESQCGDGDAWVVLEEAAGYGEGEPFPPKERTKDFALRVVRMYASLPSSVEAQVLGKQCLRAGTSVGAHYREGLRARSDAEVASKLHVALQELEETGYWFELLVSANIVPEARLASLLQEADELTAILTTCVKRINERRKSAS